MDVPRILQVVGYKNSGKTTLISAWTRKQAGVGIRVAAIKHHGHGGPLEEPSPAADSMQIVHAGAVSALAYGDGMIQLHMRADQPMLSELLAIARLSNPDVILIEGFKEAPYPKVVLLRTPEDWDCLRELSGIIGVFEDGKSALEFLDNWLRGDAG